MDFDLTLIRPEVDEETRKDFFAIWSNLCSRTFTYGKTGDIESQYPLSISFLNECLQRTTTSYLIIVIEPLGISFSQDNLTKLLFELKSSKAIMAYSDYSIQKDDGNLIKKELIDYQIGSVRDDFDFGPVLAFDVAQFKESLNSAGILKDQKYSALYGARLSAALKSLPLHINSTSYTCKDISTKIEYEKQFSYVDPKNFEVQKEMEITFTEYAKKAGFFLAPIFSELNLDRESFPVEASVIIPVRNRENTIKEAAESALNQKTNFPFNVIVVDNHSNDKTTELLESLSKTNKNLHHIIPKERDLLIGGCWNKGIDFESCGRFSVQLDSDDLYSSTETLQKIVDIFRKEKCGAVVGSYKLVNFKLEETPPGLIDHKEWSWDNGRNNALRINGLGAPRAIYTPIARNIRFENVSYGEDYAMMLAVSRNHQIGRIYESLYLCRRWDGNSDSNLSMEKINRNNTYKDWIRTREIQARLMK